MSRVDTRDRWTTALEAVLRASRALTAFWAENSAIGAVRAQSELAQQLKTAVDAADALCVELWP